MKNPIETLLHEESRFEPPSERAGRSLVPDYESHYRRSLADLEGYWEKIAGEFTWSTPWKRVLDWHYPDAKWFVGARCNITENCLDRHQSGERKNKAALVWLGENGEERIFTFGALHRQVSKLASGLRALGIRKGDRVAIYMPLTPEGIFAMLACARIGAVHSVIYAGLGSGAIRDRVVDAGARVVIATDVGYRRGKTVPLKAILDEAIADVAAIEKVVVHRRADPRSPLGRARGRLRRAARQRLPHLPRRADGQRGLALHPLHVRIDREAEGLRLRARRLHGRAPPTCGSSSATFETTTSTGVPPTSAGSSAIR